LAAGYPIGSGVVEGACRHLVKDRLERAGMRGHPDGAQAMLNLRATHLNGEWDSFWTYHVEQEDERLYRRLRETGKGTAGSYTQRRCPASARCATSSTA